MKTEISKNSERAALLLLQGELVAFPTETVYGLGGDLFSSRALEKIFEIKKRPKDNPLIVHVLGIPAALKLALTPPRAFFRLAEQFWPGPLTLVLRKDPSIPSTTPKEMETIALRCPNHPMAKELLEKVQTPVVAPSANLSGRPSPTSAFDVLEDLDGQLPLVLDGGACDVGIESTVLSLAGEKPLLLRPGSITKEALEENLQEKIDWPNREEKSQSPGTRYRHYSPKAEVRLVFSEKEAVGPFILSRSPLFGKSTYLLSQKTLYHLLREADRQNQSTITVFCDVEVQKDRALMNRLSFASNPKKELFYKES